jgi:hypothetical protein
MTNKIRLEIWSGALGVPILHKDLDVAKLSVDAQAELQQLIGASGVLDLPAVPAAPPKVCDGNQAKLVFGLAGKTQTVRIADEAVSPPLRQLIDFVKVNGS